APAVAELRVMGTYPADQPELTLAMLEKALPIKVNRLLPWWVTLELP
ncbi:iron dicitrate transport regulator FecR, partial [Gammaproteobacteria bacterium 45_16_T64]